RQSISSRVSSAERQIYRDLHQLLKQRKQDSGWNAASLQRLLSIIDAALKLKELKGRSNKRLRELLEKTRELTDIARNRPQEADRLLSKSLDLIIDFNKMSRHQETSHFGLKFLAWSSIVASLSYMLYRVGTLLTTPGFLMTDYIMGGLLILAEAFFVAQSLNSQAGILGSIKKTGDAEGKSWYPKILKGDRGDPKLRKRAVVYLPSFNEPVAGMNGNVMSSVRAVLHHGRARLLLGECSGTRYNKMGSSFGIRRAQQIVARKMIIEEIIKGMKITDDITAHYLSNVLACEETDITDPECRFFTIRRLAENAARSLRVRESKVVRLGKMLAQADAEGKALNIPFIVKNCQALKIDPQKITTIAETLVGQIASQYRQEDVTVKTYRMLSGENLTAEETTALVGNIANEFSLDNISARSLFDRLIALRAEINGTVYAATKDFDFFSTAEGRAAYYSVYRAMARIQSVEERTLAGIITDLPAKISQLAEHHLFLEGRKRLRKAVPSLTWIETRKIGQQTAEDISDLPNLHDEVEAAVVAAGRTVSLLEYLSIEKEVLEKRKASIRGICLAVCKKHLIGGKDAENFAEAVVQNIESNLQEKRFASLEFAQFLAGEVEKDGKTPKPKGAKAVAENYSNTYKFALTAFRFILEDMKISVGSDKKRDEFLKDVLKIGDITKKQADLVTLLTDKYQFSPPNARIFASRAGEAYQSLHLGLIDAVQKIAALNPSRIASPANAGGAMIKDLDKKVVEIATIPVAAPGGKGARISGCINGMTVAENIGEMQRIAISRYVEEKQGLVHIPQEIITYISREIREILPETVDPKLASPTRIAREVVTRIDQGMSPESAAKAVIGLIGLADVYNRELNDKMQLIANEIRARIMMGDFIEKLAAAVAAGQQVRPLDTFIASTLRPGWKLSRRERGKINDYGSALLEKIQEGTIVAEVDPAGRAYFRVADQASRFKKMETALLELFQQKLTKTFGLSLLLSAFASIPASDLMTTKVDDLIGTLDFGRPLKDDEKKALIEQGNDLKTKIAEGSFVIKPASGGGNTIELGHAFSLGQGQKAQKLVEKLQNIMIVPQGRSLRQIVEDIIAFRHLPVVTLRRQPLAMDLRRAAQVIQSAVDAVPAAELSYKKALDVSAKAMDSFVTPGSKNYLKEKNPPASQLEFEFININDGDYQTYKESLVEISPYFEEHESYFFVGQRQYGRNYIKNRTAGALQSGGDAYWGFPNIANSVSNIVHSWGSCVYHSTKSYSDNSKWLPKYALAPAANRTLLAGNFTGLNSRFTGKWTPGKELDYRANKIMERIRSKDTYSRLFLHSALRFIGWTADKTIVRAVNWLYNMTLLQVRDAANFLALRGALPEYFMRPINKKVLDSKGDLSNLEILSSQDYTTESEDIASSPDYMREMDFFSPGITPGSRALYDSIFLEGIGPLGNHAEDKASNEVGFGRRWARGNLAITWDLLMSELSPWRKIRAVSLALFWWTGFWQPILLAAPAAFMFLGLTPVAMGGSLWLFASLVGGNFGLAIISYVASMLSRGRTMREAMGSMGLVYSNLTALWSSSYQGMVQGEKPPFLTTPKKKVVPERMPKREMPFEYIFGFANLAASASIATFMYQAGGAWSMIGAGFWTIFNFGVTAWFVSRLNKGVSTEPPLGLGMLSAASDYLTHNFPNQRTKPANDPPSFRSEEGTK
ncbi:MAG TPA: hypothetical protein VMD02_00350, partial [Candidatus Omnitrophota bacterium]|nr:hypothetical protein [Candidatus Omnitrophota bacterium]